MGDEEYTPLTEESLKEMKAEWYLCNKEELILIQKDMLKMLNIICDLAREKGCPQLIEPVTTEMRELIKEEYKAYSIKDLSIVLDNLEFTTEVAENILSDKLVKGE